MSRAGYADDTDDQWHYIMWRGAVASAIRGRRGQAFLREAIAALDALPERKLTAYRLERNGHYCTLGAVGARRGFDLRALDAPFDCAPEHAEFIEQADHSKLKDAFGVASALLREIQFMNDEGHWAPETDEQRWARMRAWLVAQLREGTTP